MWQFNIITLITDGLGLQGRYLSGCSYKVYYVTLQGVIFSGVSFCFWAGAALWFWLFTFKKSIERKNKNNVLQVRWTKSMTEKITEGMAQGSKPKDHASLEYAKGGDFGLRGSVR